MLACCDKVHRWMLFQDPPSLESWCPANAILSIANGRFPEFSSRSDRLDLLVKANVGGSEWAVRASAGTRGGCSARVRNAASDNTGESGEGVGVGLIERGAAKGRCGWQDCSRCAMW